MARLGVGRNTAAIYDRRGEHLLLPIAHATEVQWGRTRNATSTASVTVTTAMDPGCVTALGSVHTWGHELVIFRDEQRVWEGPINRISYTRAGVTIAAVDETGWLARRRIRLARGPVLDTSAFPVPQPVTTEGDLILTRAFAPDDPNVLAHRATFTHASAVEVVRDVQANSGTYADDLNALTDQGLNYTAVGRAILLWPDVRLLGRTDTIVPERDMVTEVEVTEDGDDLATQATAYNREGLARTVSADGVTAGVSTFYGLHDRLVDAGDITTGAALTEVATAAIDLAHPAPLLVTVPSGAKLTCEAPVAIEHLVPGVLVPIESAVTARKVTATLVLDAVSVTQGPGGEDVTITLSPATRTAELP